jgi:hypothetical protein
MPDGDFRPLEPNQLSAQQREASDAILRWLQRGHEQVFHLTGYAGTGKTEVVTRLGREFPNAQFAAFTGKAAAVL